MLVAHAADARAANDALTRAGVAWEPAENDGERAAGLALGTLGPIELEGLRRSLEDLATHLEARANPMVEDLDDSDPMAPLARLMRTFLPTLTACSSVASRRRAAPDGTLVLAIAMQCPGLARTGAGVECLPLWQPQGDDRLVQRARFLEWPFAAAVVLGFDRADDAHAAREALRRRAHEEGSRIALVLEDGDLAGRDADRLAAVRAPARRALAIAQRDAKVDARLLELIAHEPPPGARLLPWLHLDAEEVLVVPKLGALASLDVFVGEVERDLRSRGVEAAVQWVRRPEPLH